MTKTIYAKDYTPPAFLIENVLLQFKLFDPAAVQVVATLYMHRNPDAAHTNDLVLDGKGLKLLNVALDGKLLKAGDYDATPEKLTVYNVPDNFTLETLVEINPAANSALAGLYQDTDGMLCTQCEAEDFRRITYYLDRPDVMSKFTVFMTADKKRYPVLLSNGNMVQYMDQGPDLHTAVWQDPFPKPAYLFALVAGNLEHIEDTYTTASGRKVTLRIYTNAHNLNKCDYAMGAIKRAMKWDEDAYGREYDLDLFNVVAVDAFNAGAMENKGLNIFNSKLVLASPETATDGAFDAIESVIGHEYFHNWSGNRVTCRDWFQLTLKEGFTVFRDQSFSADLNGADARRIENVSGLRGHQFSVDASPLAHPIRPDFYETINNFYTSTVYEKGAEVIRMMHVLLGKDGFRKGTDLYFSRHDGQAVTCDDFVQAMIDANPGSPVNWPQFKLWYSQAGTPVLDITGTYDPAAETFTLTVNQSCPATPGQPTKAAFYLPLKMGLLDQNGNDMALTLQGSNAYDPATGVLHISKATESFTFTNVKGKPVPSLLRGFSAPVKLNYPYTRDELMFLMAHDTDGFNRWEAGQMLGIAVLTDMVADYAASRPMQVDNRLVTAFKAVLDGVLNGSVDLSLAAEALLLPSEGYLAQLLPKPTNMEAVQFARKALRTTLATKLASEWERVQSVTTVTEAYAPTAAQAAKRAVANICLGYMMDNADEWTLKGCERQFYKATNMTDAMAALGNLAASDEPAKAQAALDAFYVKWQKEPLVLDMWFSMQAGARKPGGLARMQALMAHPAVDMKRPNTVRAVIGGFTGSGVHNFHNVDGTGYAWFTDRVLEVDAFNPQIAARMVGVFGDWKTYDANRQALIKAQLERIMAAPKLSKDLSEMASTLLA